MDAPDMASTTDTTLLRTGAAAKALGLSRQHLVRLIRVAGLSPAMTSDGGHQYWDLEALRAAYLDPNLTAPQEAPAASPAPRRPAAVIPALAWAPGDSDLGGLGRAAGRLGFQIDLGFASRLAGMKFPGREIALLQAVSDPERQHRVLIAPAAAVQHQYWPLIHSTCATCEVPILLLP